MFLRTITVASAVGLAVMPAAPAAHADTANESRYISDIQALGVITSPRAILADGYRVCDALNDGDSPTAVAGEMYANSQEFNGSRGLTLEVAKAIVRTAVEDLC
jgi:hypothetical protein